MFALAQQRFVIDPIQFDAKKFAEHHDSFRNICVRNAFDLYLDRMVAFRRQGLELRDNSSLRSTFNVQSAGGARLYLECISQEGSLKQVVKITAQSLAFLIGAAWAGVTTYPNFKAGIEEMCNTNDLFGSCILRDYLSQQVLSEHQVQRRINQQADIRRILHIDREIAMIERTTLDRYDPSDPAIADRLEKVLDGFRLLHRRMPLKSDFILTINSLLHDRRSPAILHDLKSRIERDPVLGDALQKDFLPTAFSSLDQFKDHELTDQVEVEGYDCRVISAQSRDGGLQIRSLVTMPLSTDADAA